MSGRKVKVGGNGNRLAHFIKIGGSTFDAVFYEGKRDILPNLAEEIIKIRLAEEGKDRPILVVTCGGGPNADFWKENKLKGTMSSKTFREATASAVEFNCKMFTDYLADAARRLEDRVDVEYSDNTADLATNGKMAQQISVVPFASEELQWQIANEIYPPNESDVHTLLCAEGLGVYLLKHRYARGVRIHFVKDTDGVYAWDPKRDDKEGIPTKYHELPIEDFLEKIDRLSYDVHSDGERELTNNHLVETQAAELLRDKLKMVHGLRIVYHTPETNLTNSVRYGKGGFLTFNKYSQKHPRYKSDTTYVKPSN